MSMWRMWEVLTQYNTLWEIYVPDTWVVHLQDKIAMLLTMAFGFISLSSLERTWRNHALRLPHTFLYLPIVAIGIPNQAEITQQSASRQIVQVHHKLPQHNPITPNNLILIRRKVALSYIASFAWLACDCRSAY